LTFITPADIRSIVKHTVYGTSGIIGLTAGMRWAFKQRLLILAYHGVVPDEVFLERYYPLHIGIAEFRRHLELLCRYFRPVSPGDVIDWVTLGRALPERSVLVTFDDGYRNNLLYAAPELRRFGVPAEIAVATGYVGDERLLWTTFMREQIISWPSESLPMPNGMRDMQMPTTLSARQKLADYVVSICKTVTGEQRQKYLDLIRSEWTPRLESEHRQMFEFLSWEEIRLLHHHGFAIGAHTVNHEILTTIAAENVDTELRDSKESIERELKTKCCWFTYPNGGPGDVNPRIAQQAKAAGFTIGLTLGGTINSATPCPLVFDRICITEKGDPYTFEVYTSGMIKNLHGQSSVRKHDIADCAGCSDIERCRFFSGKKSSFNQHIWTKFLKRSRPQDKVPLKIAKPKL
jgi:peptidoglycan/xylan/chitin deacetylase (PgdA/CDA1 family)